MHRFEDKREPRIAGVQYRVGDIIAGVALDLAIRFGYRVVEVLADEAEKAIVTEAPKVRAWAEHTYAELLEAARARGYDGDKKGKTALLSFLGGEADNGD